MAQSGYTPILIYASGTTGNTPSASNLTSSASGAELALNYFDGKLFYKDASGNVQLLASKATSINVASLSFGTTGLTPNTATTGAITVGGTLAVTNGGTGLTAVTAGYIPYGNSSTALSTSANLQFNGSQLAIGNTFNTGKQLSVTSPSSTAQSSQFSAATGTYSSAINITNSYILTIGVESSAGGQLATGSTAYNSVINSASYPIQFATANTVRAILDTAGCLGIRNTAPYTSGWNGFIAFQADTAGFGGAGNANTVVTSNAYWNAANWKYITSDVAGYLQMNGGATSIYHAVSGTAGANAAVQNTLNLSTLGNLTLGNNITTVYSWDSGYTALDLNANTSFYGSSGSYGGFALNAYRNSTVWKFKATNPSVLMEASTGSGACAWYYASSGSAGTTPSYSQTAIITKDGNLGVGGVTPGNAQQRIASNYGATPIFQNEFILTLGSPNLGTNKGYLLLAKAYAGSVGQAASWVDGTITIKRGGAGSGNRTDTWQVFSNTAYNTEDLYVQVTTNSSPYIVQTVKVTYGGTVYHAIETSVSGGNPDVGIWFNGSYGNCAPVYVDATYVSSITPFGSFSQVVNTSGSIGALGQARSNSASDGNQSFNSYGSTTLSLANYALNSSSTSGTTGINIGDASSGVNMITAEKQTNNTRSINLYCEYGFGSQQPVYKGFYNQSSWWVNGSNQAMTLDSNASLLIGTTTNPSSQAYGLVVAGPVVNGATALSIPYPGTSDVYTFPNGVSGMYLFFARQNGAPNGGIWAMALVVVGTGTGTLTVTNITTSGCSFAVSGTARTVALTNTAGGTLGAYVTWTRFQAS